MDDVAGLPIDAPVHFQVGSAMDVARALAIGPDAIRIASPHPPTTGERVRLRVVLPSGTRVLAAGEVASVEGGTPSRTVVIRLLDLDDAIRAELEAACDAAGSDEPSQATPPESPEIPAETEPPPEAAPPTATAEATRTAPATQGASPTDTAQPDVPCVEPDGAEPIEIDASVDPATRTLLFRVVYRSSSAFLREYRSNLGRGGLFVRTDHVLERLTPVIVELVLPGTEEVVRLTGSVVHRMTADPSRGRQAGLGVHFRDTEHGELDPVHSLARRLGGAKG